MFGYKPTVYMPKPGSKDIYKVSSHSMGTLLEQQDANLGVQRLQQQCENMKIPILEPSSDTSLLKSALTESDVVLDAIFGFSFKGPVRSPFDDALKLISASKLGIVSVDVPSGWEVDGGKADGIALEPDVLVSLTAPKEGVKEFKGRHFLGGRFVTK
jgi:NAD(P)H-hydrate epimerase